MRYCSCCFQAGIAKCSQCFHHHHRHQIVGIVDVAAMESEPLSRLALMFYNYLLLPLLILIIAVLIALVISIGTMLLVIAINPRLIVVITIIATILFY